jgi:hypothetical protein
VRILKGLRLSDFVSVTNKGVILPQTSAKNRQNTALFGTADNRELRAEEAAEAMN